MPCSVTQSGPTLLQLPGQQPTRILEWVATSSFRGSSHPGVEPASPVLHWQADSLPLSLQVPILEGLPVPLFHSAPVPRQSCRSPGCKLCIPSICVSSRNSPSHPASLPTGFFSKNLFFKKPLWPVLKFQPQPTSAPESIGT